MINKKTALIAVLVIALLLSSCEKTEDGKRTAISTINIINDFVKNVAGDKIGAVSLLPVGSDPHIYEPVPRDVQKIADSDIVFYNGFNLEKWLFEILENAGSSRQAFQVAKNLNPMTTPKGDPDPHLWMDPVYAVTYVENIRDSLSEFDPENAEYYKQNAENYIKQLEELDAWIKSKVAEIPEQNRKLVTTHDAYAYFGKRYGFKVIGSIWGITTEDEPSAKEIAALIDKINSEKVQAVFFETTINPKLMERVAAEANVKLGKPLYGDSLGIEGSSADTYIGMVKTNVESIVEALR